VREAAASPDLISEEVLDLGIDAAQVILRPAVARWDSVVSITSSS
jgi:hypothetical protein